MKFNRNGTTEKSAMSERTKGDSVVEWLEIDLGKLSDTERVALMNEIMDLLTAQELGQVRDNADKKRSGKLKKARRQFIREMKRQAKELDLDLGDLIEAEMDKTFEKHVINRQRLPIKAKYIS